MKNVWPIVDRELRVAARRPATWRTRLIVAGVAIGLTVFFLWKAMGLARQLGMVGAVFGAGSGISPGMVGSVVFLELTLVTGIAALLMGPALTGDCISRERREGTLGLLFLTDLSGWDVVLGKLVAAAWNAGYCLLGVLPVLALPVLLGGVTLGQVGLLAVALLNALFVGLAVGMLTSSFCRDARQATGLAFSGVVGLAAFPWAIFIWLVSRDQPLAVPQAAPVLLASPFLLFLQVGMQSASALAAGFIPPLPYQVTGGMFAGAAVGQHLFAWLLLWIVARRVRTVWQDKAASSSSRGWRSWWATLRYGAPARREELRRQLLARNPFLWLSQREVWKRSYPWLLFAGLAGAFLFGAWEAGPRFTSIAVDFSPTFIVIAHVLLAIWMVSEAAHRLCEERQAGALELLLTTPLDERAILAGQGAGLRRLFLWPVVLLLLVDLWWAQHSGEARWSFPDFHVRLETVLLAVCLTRSLVASRWIATWLALRGLPINSVVGASLGLGVVVPWMATVAVANASRWLREFVGLWGAWQNLESVLPWLLLGLWLGWVETARWLSRRNSLRDFRELAASPLRREAKASWWSRLSGAWRSVGRT